MAIGKLPGSVAASIPRNIQEYVESGEAEQTFVVAYDMMQRRLPVSLEAKKVISIAVKSLALVLQLLQLIDHF